MKDYKQEHELKRREVWVNAWVSVAGASNSYDKETPTGWADAALKGFDKRFSPLGDEREQSKETT